MTSVLTELQRTWEGLAKFDPMWAVLTDGDKIGRKWDPEEFFRTGHEEITHLMALLPVGPRERAIDFGCGLGRLTQALTSYYGEVVGVDISPTMLELARSYDQTGRCEFKVNASNDLGILESNSFDLVLSCITLQHMPPRDSLSYIRDFVRLIKPGGMILFNMPSHRVVTPRSIIAGLVPRTLRRRRLGGIEMFGIKRSTIESTLQKAGAQMLRTQPLAQSSTWPGFLYLATK